MHLQNAIEGVDRDRREINELLVNMTIIMHFILCLLDALYFKHLKCVGYTLYIQRILSWIYPVYGKYHVRAARGPREQDAGSRISTRTADSQSK